MNKTELIRALEETVPPLAGKLRVERVLYRKADNKAYFSFLCDVLVPERDFLALERRLRGLFPKMRIALRVASPGLAEDFLTDIGRYTSVLKDFLRRQSPAMRAWLDDVGWSVEGGRILLTCPDDFAIAFFRRYALDEKLTQAVWDIFRLRLPVGLVKCGEREAWVSMMRAQAAERRAQDLLDARAGNPHLLELPPDDAPAVAWTQDATAADLRAPWEDAGPGAQAGPAGTPAPPADRAKPAPKPAPKAARNAGDGHPPARRAAPGGTVLKGRAIADPPMPIVELAEDSGIVVVEGEIIGVNEPRELKGGETVMVTFALGDDTSTIYCKAFYNYRMKRAGLGATPQPPTDEEKKRVADQVEMIRNGTRVRLRGDCRQDTFLGELSLGVRDMQRLPARERLDLAPEGERRVELHMHSNMSAMDATADAADLVAQAAKWGHPAVAITDHGVTQAFPAAFGAAKKHGIKFIPGVEGYLCDLIPIVADADARALSEPVVVLDFETTGLSPAADRIIEIGAVKLAGGEIVEELSLLCDPGVSLKPKITEITGITDLMLRGKESPAEGVKKLLAFIGDCAVAAHNAPFDVGFLSAECARMNIVFHAPVLDTLVFARRLYPNLRSYKLGALCRTLGVSLKNAHRAVHDAAATARCLAQMVSETAARGARTLADIDRVAQGESMSDTHHVIVLCKTQKGLENLNHLVSDGHVLYFNRHPNMPRHLIKRYREGLILGSACEAGELFRAVVTNQPEEELMRLASFYDYLEIQPVANNRFLLKNGEARDEEQLRDFNRRVVALGEKLRIPVVATGDVHFKEPQDAVYRAILQAGLGFEDCDEQPPLYFKTTDEMLAEFAYLGAAKAREVVVDAPRAIADQVETLQLFPRHPKGEETFQPFWPEAAHDIETMSRARARELYGDPLPALIEARLKKELDSIIGYGFATLYSIAQKLVAKSLADGYLVGSRGSVGSSLVATLCGITEVNPLPAHYRCDHCHQAFFTPPEMGAVGVDLPDKACELCGRPMQKDGYTIPFEVFLGFEGDKVPDIDLNFSGEYQPRAHAYIEELFGKGYVFRAGTISGLAEKTAFGFAAKYLEERGIRAGRAHKERLAAGCMGVKRTTGQHPGGIVVLPKDYDICQFTAIQHPADDIEGATLTTHYDFRSMHDILVKLDCLGHDDPTMMHRLEELTGVSFRDIPLDDQRVMSLFQGPEALGVTAESVMSPTGTLGVPEFGTQFVQGMLMDTKPSTMEELVRISGLSHGTDVWLGNAKDLIDSGTARLPECFCTRDDIMNFLIAKGLENKMSFDIMESVRKGKGLKPEMEQAMLAHDVPAWAIDSCKKIKYMFPRGHAVAYVIMGLRVAWYKVYRPQSYYAAYFTIRADGFDAATMILSDATIRDRLREYAARDEKLTPKEKLEENALHMILEMQERGIRLLPVSLYHSDKRRFLPEGADLRCPFLSLNGFPEAAADGILEARDTPFLSVEDLKLRAHLGVAAVDMLRAQGALEGMPESSQVDLFSMLG
ncbi:MAG: PolC-type DNA polymerase III [Clostridiales bacterium]|nr:PolC-type DNA polymerase III [Clostridiales bacterium]